MFYDTDAMQQTEEAMDTPPSLYKNAGECSASGTAKRR